MTGHKVRTPGHGSHLLLALTRHLDLHDVLRGEAEIIEIGSEPGGETCDPIRQVVHEGCLLQAADDHGEVARGDALEVVLRSHLARDVELTHKECEQQQHAQALEPVARGEACLTTGGADADRRVQP